MRCTVARLIVVLGLSILATPRPPSTSVRTRCSTAASTSNRFRPNTSTSTTIPMSAAVRWMPRAWPSERTPACRASSIISSRAKPIILYASQSDFQQTNVVDATGEGLGGVTEFFKHRAVLPFTGSYAEFEHVLQHEMVHQFQYDVYSRGRPGAGWQALVAGNPPAGVMRGMSEYLD